MKKFFIITIVLFGAIVLSRNAAFAACGAGDPTGHYEGTAQSKEAGLLKIALDLRCESNIYTGELLTPVGTFAINDGTFNAGHLALRFGGGAIGDQGSIALDLQGNTGAGTFRLAADSGAFRVTRIGDAHPPAVTTPDLNLTAAQWHDDLSFLAEQLTAHHVNPFQFTPKATFEQRVAALDAQLSTLNSDQIYTGMDAIANLIGDGHTYLDFPTDLALLPVQIRRFGTDYRIVAAAAGNERILGLRVTKIGDMPIGAAHDAMLVDTPLAETDVLRDARATNFLTIGMMLHGLGITPDRSTAQYTVQSDAGNVSTVMLHAMTPAQAADAHYAYAWRKPPLYRQQPNNSFWFTYIAASKTVYCNFQSYQDLRGHAEALLKFVRMHATDKLAIDLRANGGGDFKEGLTYLIDPIAKLPSINRKGHLFILVGPNTFSAAMSNAAQFRTQTKALLVGQTVGERPNSNQEANEVRLPNSHLRLRYSTQYYAFVPAGPNALVPDKEIAPTWAQFQAGEDPALDWVLTYGS